MFRSIPMFKFGEILDFFYYPVESYSTIIATDEIKLWTPYKTGFPRIIIWKCVAVVLFRVVKVIYLYIACHPEVVEL